MGKLLLGLLLPLGLLACETMQGGRGGAERAPDGGALRTGRALYEKSCSRCHALFMPASFDAQDWRFLVPRYGRKARLTDRQRRLVLDYLVANARDMR